MERERDHVPDEIKMADRRPRQSLAGKQAGRQTDREADRKARRKQGKQMDRRANRQGGFSSWIFVTVCTVHRRCAHGMGD